MSEEIEVGEYVRTNKGELGKIIHISNNTWDKKYSAKYNIEFIKGNIRRNYYASIRIIKKHSKNLIDLIEVGDIVNGNRVIMNLSKSKKHYGSKDDFITCEHYTYEDNEIKTILAHEQYERELYRVEGSR